MCELLSTDLVPAGACVLGAKRPLSGGNFARGMTVRDVRLVRCKLKNAQAPP